MTAKAPTASVSLLAVLLIASCITPTASSQGSVVITIDVSGGGKLIIEYITPDGNPAKVTVKEGIRKIEALNGTIMNVTAIPDKNSELLMLSLDGNQVTDTTSLTLVVGRDLKNRLEAVFIPAQSEEPSATPTLTIRVTQTPVGREVLVNASIRVLGDINCPATLIVHLDIDGGSISSTSYYSATPGYYSFLATVNETLLQSWTTSIPGRVAAELLCGDLELASDKAEIIIHVPTTQGQGGSINVDVIIVGVGLLAIILVAALVYGGRENINT